MSMQLSVLQLNNYIKRIIDNEELLIGIGLYGEVSNFKIASGNAFFDLKEDGASISCMMFGSDVTPLENGMQVMLYGRLSFYAKTGKMSFVARRAEEIGKGALYVKYLELKEKLEKEGIFDISRKKPIPTYSKKIGVVTSETGAVLHDIMKIAREKNPKTDFVLFPAKVQGEGAEKTIVEGINYFSGSDVDVVIVARGGGSFEDLAPFNTEAVARAIFSCNVPVVSAVGHETDISISDFAADLRCPTPTAASETCVYDYFLTKKSLSEFASSIAKSVENICIDGKELLAEYFSEIYELVGEYLVDNETNLKNSAKKFDGVIAKYFSNESNKYELVNLRIQKENPLSLLSKGYAVATKNGESVRSVNDVENGDDVDVRLIDGLIKTKVIGKESKKYE